MIALRPGMPVREVVPGDPGRVLSLASQLLSIAAGFDQSARAFAPSSESWFGPAKEAFVALIGAYPPVYRQVAESFAAASVACRSHAAELEQAQLEAGVAVRRVEDAVRLSAVWQARRRERDGLARAAAAGDVGASAQLAGLAPLGEDPGAALMRTLSARVAAAQQRVEESARRSAALLREAGKARIPEPNLAMRTLVRAGTVEREIVFGALEATYDLGVMVLKLQPSRIVLDPKGWAADTVGMAAGLKHGVKHPVEFGKAVLDWETWATNPGRAMGHLVPDVVIAVASGGAGAAARGASRGASVVRRIVQDARRMDREQGSIGLPDALTPQRTFAVQKPHVADGIKAGPRPLEWSHATINGRGVEAVANHLARFDPGSGEIAMLERLKAISAGDAEATDHDLRFFTHELREAVLYRRAGYPIGQPEDADAAYDLWDTLHTQALRDYGLTRAGAPNDLFHPSVRH